MDTYSAIIKSDLGQTDFKLKAADAQTAIKQAHEIAQPEPGATQRFEIFDPEGAAIHRSKIKSADSKSVWTHILKFQEKAREQEGINKLKLIKKWIRENVKRNPPECHHDDIKNDIIVVDKNYIFFFEGRDEHVALKSVLKKRRKDRAASYSINGQPGKNTKRLF